MVTLGKAQNMTKKISKSLKPVNRFCDLIGLQFTEMEKGFCRTELKITDSHLNPYGTLHGGVVYSLADTGMGGALSTLLEEDERCSTLEIKINYLKSMRSGLLSCDTKVIQKGKNIAFLESEIKNSEGILMATATGTFNVFKIPTRGKGPTLPQDEC
jgi:acyl-CoA thioesterase